ncbi:restriction endonuclease type II-like protein [Aspergillus carlsbadensis]|nr:restriction endonuclease type II-like protein [Aspergillus carlsbadensis]
MAEEFDADDADFESVLRAEAATPTPRRAIPTPQPVPERPQPPKVEQPKPQALASKSGPSSILVSTRQKGNPILNHIKLLPWEYADIPADYVIGATTCALFLSLKYHRLHPEYVYSRIRPLAGKYLLRILLIIVDIPNHEESLKELSKTSIINNLTLILCWSAPEAAHYLELFKSCEHSQPTAIRTQQAQSYKDSLVEFVTAPRSINKSDAASLISTFGSLQNAVNAQPEQISAVPGWGEKKVKQWCNAVREDFRVEKAKKRTAPKRTAPGQTMLDSNEEESLFVEAYEPAVPRPKDGKDEEMDEGISAALAKLRENGG